LGASALTFELEKAMNGYQYLIDKNSKALRVPSREAFIFSSLWVEI